VEEKDFEFDENSGDEEEDSEGVPFEEGIPDFGKPPDRSEGERDRDLDEKEVSVVGVFEHLEPGASQPAAFVLLRDNAARCVPIWIGRAEAFAISIALEGATADRPLTHDLMKNILTRLGGNVEKVIIDDLWHDTYYAKIYVAVDGQTIEIDSRPSDAIALGLRAKAPIFMAEAVLSQAAVYEE
jgi:bifunctional DNase/RNase